MFEKTWYMRSILTALLLFIYSFCFCQKYATSDDGKRVKLNANGTWEYAKEPLTGTKIEEKHFNKPALANTLLKSKKNNFAVWYDPSKWKVSNKLDNENAEFELSLKGEDGYCMAISERIQVDIENLKNIALKNAQEADPNATIDQEEDRIVNGKKIKMLKILCTVQSIKFVLLGYYASDESGTIQLVCYTAQNLSKNYEKDFWDILNGLTVANN